MPAVGAHQRGGLDVSAALELHRDTGILEMKADDFAARS